MAANPDVPWDLVAEIRRSHRKTQIIELLASEPAAANEIASEIDLQREVVSNYFRELKNMEPPLITCLTPNQPHHRIYGLTDTGETVYEHL